MVRHGFPDEARCLAYDPVQRLLAIGTGHGTVRMIGKSGGLITACANDMIHLWNFRQKIPEVVHSVQLNKEAVTSIHLPMGSKWLYVGTDKVDVNLI
uniref:WD_REPEATS_REGION domain-containing protein n=1 Tax=Heterorhabditis bacteriophora TaxID=37862 RepID=A0A1I7XNA8_HETBA